MDGLPVTIRLLDPPLHEFLPATPEDIQEMATQMSVSVGAVEAIVERLHEQNSEVVLAVIVKLAGEAIATKFCISEMPLTSSYDAFR